MANKFKKFLKRDGPDVKGPVKTVYFRSNWYRMSQEVHKVLPSSIFSPLPHLLHSVFFKAEDLSLFMGC